MQTSPEVVDMERALAGFVARWQAIDPAERAAILAEQAELRRDR